MMALVETNEKLKSKVKPYTSYKSKQMKKIGKEGNSDTHFLIKVTSC